MAEPTDSMMPNFRNVHKQETDFLRGYIYVLVHRDGAMELTMEKTCGAYKDAM